MAQKTELVGLDVVGALCFGLPTRFGGIVRALGQGNIVGTYLLMKKSVRVTAHLLVAGDGVRSGKRGYKVGVAPFEIPEVVEVAV